MGPEDGSSDRLPPAVHARPPAIELVKRLTQAGGSPNKALGQHFLVSDRVVEAIVRASSSFAGILEIGPGPGVLTSPLSAQAQLVALELDPRMASASQAASPGAEVREADALAEDWTPILLALPEPRGLVSNMPYNITGPLLGKAAEAAPLLAGAVLMMQAEVAQKIVAPPGARERGFLSVWLQMTFTIRRVISAPPGCFSPPPKVESTVLAFAPRPRPPESSLLQLIKQGFRQPRKTLANNLSHPSTLPALQQLGLSPSIRPHQMEEDQWRELHRLVRAAS